MIPDFCNIDLKSVLKTQPHEEPKESVEHKCFAPLYSQKAYESAFVRDRAIAPKGDSFWDSKERITSQERSELLIVIDELIRLTGYSENTYYLAISLLDRFMYARAL